MFAVLKALNSSRPIVGCCVRMYFLSDGSSRKIADIRWSVMSVGFVLHCQRAISSLSSGGIAMCCSFLCSVVRCG